MTTLSVIIPTHNEEDPADPIIDRVLAIRPALAQSRIDDLELIVVDDNSGGTVAVLGLYPGVRLVQHRTNHSYDAAIKTGFALALGQWLGFLGYAVLAWTPKRSAGWAPALSIRRVPSQKTEVEVGVDQVKRLCPDRQVEWLGYLWPRQPWLP